MLQFSLPALRNAKPHPLAGFGNFNGLELPSLEQPRQKFTKHRRSQRHETVLKLTTCQESIALELLEDRKT
jgi:hypothetical protein